MAAMAARRAMAATVGVASTATQLTTAQPVAMGAMAVPALARVELRAPAEPPARPECPAPGPMVAMVDEVATGLWLAVSTTEWRVRQVRQGQGPAVAALTEARVHQAPTGVLVVQAETVVQEAALQELVAMAATAEIASDASSH